MPGLRLPAPGGWVAESPVDRAYGCLGPSMDYGGVLHKHHVEPCVYMATVTPITVEHPRGVYMTPLTSVEHPGLHDATNICRRSW